jgi:hypothetical protein
MNGVIRQFARTTLLVGLLLAIETTALQAQDSNTAWSPPQVLGDGWWQSITVDRQDTPHVGWFGSFGEDMNADLMMYTFRQPDGTWTVPNDVLFTGEGGFTVRNSLVATSDGILHAVFRAGNLHRFASAPIAASATTSSWSPPVNISGQGYYVDMIADTNDVLHLVYSGAGGEAAAVQPLEGAPCSLCYNLYYRRSTDGGATWSQPYPVSIEPDSGSDRPSIIQGSSGRLYIFWDEGVDWYVSRGQPKDVRLVYSNDGGLTWSDSIILNGSDDLELRPIQITLTELRDGTLLAVWRYATDRDRHIYYQLSSDLGITWTDPTPIPRVFTRSMNDTPLDDYEIITDQRGVAHLFLVGQADESSVSNPSLYHLQYRQNDWRVRQTIFYSSQERPEWPQAALGPQGDIHLTWFVRGLAEGITSFTSATAGLKVYYSYRAPISPDQPTQAFNPTRVPQPTATPFQRLEPTLTAFPTTEPVEFLVSMTTSDNQAAQTLLGGLFATGIFCLGVVLFYRFGFRR